MVIFQTCCEGTYLQKHLRNLSSGLRNIFLMNPFSKKVPWNCLVQNLRFVSVKCWNFETCASLMFGRSLHPSDISSFNLRTSRMQIIYVYFKRKKKFSENLPPNSKIRVLLQIPKITYPLHCRGPDNTGLIIMLFSI